jgi:hypothetical protein
LLCDISARKTHKAEAEESDDVEVEIIGGRNSIQAPILPRGDRQRPSAFAGADIGGSAFRNIAAPVPRAFAGHPIAAPVPPRADPIECYTPLVPTVAQGYSSPYMIRRTPFAMQQSNLHISQSGTFHQRNGVTTLFYPDPVIVSGILLYRTPLFNCDQKDFAFTEPSQVISHFHSLSRVYFLLSNACLRQLKKFPTAYCFWHTFHFIDLSIEWRHHLR